MKTCTEFVKNLPMIEVSLSLIGLTVKIISPKIRLPLDMKRTLVLYTGSLYFLLLSGASLNLIVKSIVLSRLIGPYMSVASALQIV